MLPESFSAIPVAALRSPDISFESPLLALTMPEPVALSALASATDPDDI